MGSVARYFDLMSGMRGRVHRAEAAGQGMAPTQPTKLPLNLILVLQYGSLLLGILGKKYLDEVSTAAHKPFWTWQLVVVSLVVATAVFPAVYKKALEETDAALPVFVQMCTIFAAGVGYKSLFDGIANVAIH
jgi:hypothetical protein